MRMFDRFFITKTRKKIKNCNENNIRCLCTKLQDLKMGKQKKKMKCEQEANEWNEEANYVRDDRQSSFRAQLIQKREPNNTTQRTNKPKGVISCSKCVHSPLHLFECMIVYIRFFHSVDDVHVCVFTWDRLGVYACAFLCHPFSSYIYIYIRRNFIRAVYCCYFGYLGCCCCWCCYYNLVLPDPHKCRKTYTDINKCLPFRSTFHIIHTNHTSNYIPNKIS